MLQERISDIPAMSREELNLLVFIDSLNDNSLKNKLVDMKYSDKHSNLDDIISSVQFYEANNIIASNDLQGNNKSPETGRSRKRKRSVREDRPTLSPSKPRDKEKRDLNKLDRENEQYNKPDNINKQSNVNTYPPQGKSQLFPGIKSKASDDKDKYLPPNTAKAVNSWISFF